MFNLFLLWTQHKRQNSFNRFNATSIESYNSVVSSMKNFPAKIIFAFLTHSILISIINLFPALFLEHRDFFKNYQSSRYWFLENLELDKIHTQILKICNYNNKGKKSERVVSNSMMEI